MKITSDQTGYTLVELLVTIGIAAIMLAIAVPSLKEIYDNNVSLSYSSTLRTALYRAQNEAVRRNRIVTIKAKNASNQFWQGGWDIYLDANNNNTIDASEEIISSYIPRNNNQTLKSKNASFGEAISFDPSGIPLGNTGSTNGEFWLCRADNNVTLSRTVKIEFSGFISVIKGATCP